MSDTVAVLKEALTKAYDQGYTNGRTDALKALSTSMGFVYDLGVLPPEDKKGFKIALDTIGATLKILEQDKGESGL